MQKGAAKAALPPGFGRGRILKGRVRQNALAAQGAVAAAQGKAQDAPKAIFFRR